MSARSRPYKCRNSATTLIVVGAMKAASSKVSHWRMVGARRRGNDRPMCMTSVETDRDAGRNGPLL